MPFSFTFRQLAIYTLWALRWQELQSILQLAGSSGSPPCDRKTISCFDNPKGNSDGHCPQSSHNPWQRSNSS